MKPSDYKISLDILESQSQYSLPMKKGDTARVVYITLREGGVPYEIGTDCFAVLSGRKPDGTALENNCVIKGNTIIYSITPQTTSASGLVDCEIKLYGADTDLICSSRFSIVVDERVVSDEEVESTSEFSALTQLYSDVAAGEVARVDAEAERVAAEGDRAKAEQKREANITQAIEDAEEATDKANDIADTLQTKLDNGEFKGEKGDKGDTPAIDQKYNPTSENAQSGAAVAEALSDVANAIRSKTSGNPIIIDDATSYKHKLDIKSNANETVYVRGKNLIPFDNKAYNNGKYVAGQTYTMNNVDFTINDDGSVTLNGTSTAPVVIPLIFGSEYKTGIHTVTLSGSPEGASSSTYCLRLEKENMVGAYGAEDYGNGKTIENVDLSGCSVNIVVFNGKTIDATFYPMLEFGDTVSEFIYPVCSCSATADENGVVDGLVSVAPCMSIFTETGASVECIYNRDTTAVIGDIETALDSIIAMQENLIGGASV